jgi:6-phosphogluconolactonase
MRGGEIQKWLDGGVVTVTVDLRRLTTPQDLFQAAAEEVIRVATDAIAQRGRFTIALSGGSTPKNLYTLIAANAGASVPWEKVFFFWSDERHVPLDDPDSNYRMAKESLLSKVPVPPANVFPIPAGKQDAEAAANDYEQTLKKFFASGSELPRFDLVLLGMGPDGHTASLFPETPALQEKSRLVVANRVDKLKTNRITFTLPLLNAARCVLFLVSGADKAAVLHEVLEGDAPAEKYPSKLVRPSNGKPIWFVDRAAASQLTPA